MNEIYIGGKRIALSPTKAIGKGGEADIYDIGGGKVLKVFKTPDHPDYTGQPHEQAGAKARIEAHQRKLRVFPRNFPDRVIVPEELATDKSGNRILGYTMSFLKGAEVLLRYADKDFRAHGISPEVVKQIFLDLHPTVCGIHKTRDGVIGDFNDLNVLVDGTKTYLIDADSMQFDNFLCQVFTAKFVDPLLCDPKASAPLLCKPHNPLSDWYAFAVMLMQCLLYVDPYGGVYKPKDPTKRIPHSARPLQRITVFNPEVKYPKPAIPYGVLSDEMLDYFYKTFERDQREIFPIKLLEQFRWTTCTTCGTEHARGICPTCAAAVPGLVKEIVTIRGKVKATSIFRTNGVILTAAFQGGRMHWLYHERGAFWREDGSKVAMGSLDPKFRFRIKGQSTIMAKTNQMVTITPGKTPESMIVDSYGGVLPMFDTNTNHSYWVANGQLVKDGNFGSEYIGDVLPGQTLFWTGEKMGFGFYRAGNLSIAFVFDAEKPGINDMVKLPVIRGQLSDSTCVFSKEMCWFFTTTRESGKTINRCAVIRASGEVIATAEAQMGDGSWLGTIRGKCAAGDFLLSATDDGIVRVEPDNGQISVTREFPDTDPFVDASSYLFTGSDGLYVVGQKEVRQLRIS